MKAEPIEVRAEPCLLAGDPEIGDKRQAKATSYRGTVNRANDRLPGAEQPDCLLVEVAAGPAATSLCDGPGLHALGEIRAGAERSAFGGEYDRPAARIGIELLEGLANLSDQLAVKEIVRRPAHLDRGDEAVPADIDIAHSGPPQWFRLTISASTTLSPCPCGCTMTGLRSISSIRSAWSAAKRDKFAINSARAARSAGGAPRTPSRSAAPFKSPSSVDASSRPIGTGA